MQYLGEADPHQVMAATPCDPDTLNATRVRLPFQIWRIQTLADIAAIEMQLPRECRAELEVELARDGVGPIGDLYPLWAWWIHSRKPHSIPELARHVDLVSEVQAAGSFLKRPILFDDTRRIHDGKHRLLAAYELLRAHSSPSRETAQAWAPLAPALEVFWNGPPRA